MAILPAPQTMKSRRPQSKLPVSPIIVLMPVAHTNIVSLSRLVRRNWPWTWHKFPKATRYPLHMEQFTGTLGGRWAKTFVHRWIFGRLYHFHLFVYNPRIIYIITYYTRFMQDIGIVQGSVAWDIEMDIPEMTAFAMFFGYHFGSDDQNSVYDESSQPVYKKKYNIYESKSKIRCLNSFSTSPFDSWQPGEWFCVLGPGAWSCAPNAV